MTWHAKINRPSDRVILHLMDIATHGEDQPKLTSVAEVNAFLASHPEIDAVNVYCSRFPRRPIPLAKFDQKMVAKLFPKVKAKA
jgi:hypothetical protein